LRSPTIGLFPFFPVFAAIRCLVLLGYESPEDFLCKKQPLKAGLSSPTYLLCDFCLQGFSGAKVFFFSRNGIQGGSRVLFLPSTTSAPGVSRRGGCKAREREMMEHTVFVCD
jgi:hypothetical protein